MSPVLIKQRPVLGQDGSSGRSPGAVRRGDRWLHHCLWAVRTPDTSGFVGLSAQFGAKRAPVQIRPSRLVLERSCLSLGTKSWLAVPRVLEAQAGAPPDAVAQELEIGADFHFVVHHAAGIVPVQQGISVTEALIRLRSYAFGHDRLLADVAEDVVTHRLRLQ
jgi:hypothetical protein